MSKSKRKSKSKPLTPKLPSQNRKTDQTPQSQSIREFVESVVIAFVLAFLFRTFEAEAFVIPTGSMAPTLMGRHKDVECTMCGHRFQITASEEESDEAKYFRSRGYYSRAEEFDCLAGKCPMCRYTMPVRSDIPSSSSEIDFARPIERQPSYHGDRILVNKYVYSFADPQRWDVVVFKYPGKAEMNYIKRLVGLPGETLRIYHGDLFMRDDSQNGDGDFQLARKPPETVHAMRQLVHDTDFDPVVLYEAGWPFRWDIWTGGDESKPKWSVQRKPTGKVVQQRFSSDAQSSDPAWIRYQHLTPEYEDWLQVIELLDKGQLSSAMMGLQAQPQLITDFNSYNSRVQRKEAERTGNLDNNFNGRSRMGLHWVGDLILEADLEVENAAGELLLDLVEGGQHFTCQIDLATGKATLRIDGLEKFAPTAATPLSETGDFRLEFANVDDQLLLWIDGRLIEFDQHTTYDADEVFGRRSQIRPQTSTSDPGDLSPAGVGARGAELHVDRLRLWRDIYYIADDWRRNSSNHPVTDMPDYRSASMAGFFRDPKHWDDFQQRRSVEFPLGDDQFFVMGDNSPESSDARLWRGGNARGPGRPGGAYLERRLLIGKALCVYWPHSWHRLPGTPIPFPLFPNFADMRLVR